MANINEKQTALSSAVCFFCMIGKNIAFIFALIDDDKVKTEGRVWFLSKYLQKRYKYTCMHSRYLLRLDFTFLL